MLAAISCKDTEATEHSKKGTNENEGDHPMSKDDIKFAGVTKQMLREPDAQIAVTRNELLRLMMEADKALDGDSNDDEHDALYSVREELGEIVEAPERRRALSPVVEANPNDDFAQRLKAAFPWLGTENQVSGADTIGELNDLYHSLTLKPDTQRRIAEGIEKYCPPTSLARLLKKYEDAAFNCGEWHEGDDEPYAFTQTRLDNAHAALLKALNIMQPTEMEPAIAWAKPLEPSGPDSDPALKLFGAVEILGHRFHVEAYEVYYKGEDRVQTGKQDEDETYLGEILSIVQGAADTVEINGREYVMAITPGQR
jgi:hypothetical protein